MKRNPLITIIALTLLAAALPAIAATSDYEDKGTGPYTFSYEAADPLDELPPSLLWEGYLSKTRLAATKKDVLEYLRNYIFARNGYTFKSKKWKDEFTNFTWYEPNPDFSWSLFNKFEAENMRRISAAEKNK